MAEHGVALTGPGTTPGPVAMPDAEAAALELLAELTEAGTVPEPVADARPRWARRTGTRAQRTRTRALLADPFAALMAAPAPAVEAVDTLPPDHPARVLLSRAEGPGGLFAHAEAATVGATLADLPAEAVARLDSEHLRTAEVVHQCAAQHYRARWRTALTARAGHAVALALLVLALAERALSAPVLPEHPEAPDAEGWPPAWRPPPQHLALTTSTATAAPPAPAPPVLGPRACAPEAA